MPARTRTKRLGNDQPIGTDLVPSAKDVITSALKDYEAQQPAREEQDPEEIAIAIAMQMLNATTEDAILGGATSMEEVENEAIMITGFTLIPSEVGELGYFAVVKFIDLNERERTLTTGSTNILCQLLALFRGGLLPMKCKFTAKETGQGWTVWRLSPVGKG